MQLFGLKVLLIGASHLSTPGYLGTNLHDQLTTQGAKVHTLGTCGAQPSNWVIPKQGNCGGLEKRGVQTAQLTIGQTPKTKTYLQLVSEDQPDLVIVVLGDNLADYKAPFINKSLAYEEIKKLTSVIEKSKASCIWIGPTWGNEGARAKKTFKRVNEVSDLLKFSVKPCQYMNSLEMSPANKWHTTDGQHLTLKDYKEWSNKIMEEIQKTNLSI